MPLRPDSLSWVASTLSGFDEVVSASPHPPMTLQLEIKGVPLVCALIIHEKVVEASAILGKISDEHEFVMNIPSRCLWEGDAIELCGLRDLGWGGLGDLYRATRDEMPYEQPNEYRFATRMLLRHNNVARVERLKDKAFELHRHSGPPLRVGLTYSYELTADDVRSSYERHGPFDLLFDTNPNGGPTQEAINAADSMDVWIGKASDIMRRLGKRT